jgi:hypothetical protein
MRGHLSDEILIDALDGAPEPLRHARECDGCGRRLDALREALGQATLAEVPEPSPLYWQAFRAQVGRRIGARSQAGWRFAFWPALAAAAAVLVAASGIVIGLRGPISAPAVVSAPAWSALPPESEDQSLPVLEGALASLGEDSTVADCRGLTHCLAALTDEEQQALADAVRRELAGRQS